MKLFFTLTFACIILACSKSKEDDKEDRTLRVVVEDYVPQSGNRNWAIKLIFNPQVTIQGSVKIDFDIFHTNSFDKHVSEKINFSISNSNTFLYQTGYASAPPLMGWDIRNIKVDSLNITSGMYNITLK